MPIQKRQKFLKTLSNDEAVTLLYDWKFWARASQLPPSGDWFGWLLRSGRGAGKTRTGAEWIIQRAKDGYKRIALIGQTKADVRDTMIEVGESSIMQISPPWFMPDYQPSKRRLVWPNGAIAVTFSGDEPDQLRGPQHDTAWVDELAKFKFPAQTWDNMEMGLRSGPDPRVIVTTTPRPIEIIKRLIADPDIIDVQESTFANINNINNRFLSRMRDRYEGTRLGRQELGGEILEDNPGALWKRDDIESSRVGKAPLLLKIFIGVDPAETKTGNETGIVAVGLGYNGHGYVLGDRSLQGSPGEWGQAVVTAYFDFEADRVIAEGNAGGEMVEYTIHTVDDGASVPVKRVHATRGKRLRAEPVAALYEQGKVHHVGMFAELEDQQAQWEPGDASPDRLDALVHGLTALMVTGRKKPVRTF